MAYGVEFVTHGGFEIVRDAWLFVSNIFNNKDFQVLVGYFFIGTLLFSAIAGPLRHLLGHGSPTAWLASGLVAVLLYAAFFQTYGDRVGKWDLNGEITVYDDVKNQNEVIGNLPIGLVALAGIVNEVEVGLEGLVDTLITGPYVNTVEGVMSVKFLREAKEGQLRGAIMAVVPTTVIMSIDSFMKDCASTVLSANPSLQDQLYGQGTASLVDVFNGTANPAIYTVTYLDSSGNPASTAATVDCSEAWKRIRYAIDATHMRPAITKFCEVFGFDIANTNSLGECMNILEEGLSALVGVDKTPESFAADVLLGARWDRYLMSIDNSIALAGIMVATKGQSAMLASGMAAEQWIPHIKNILTALVVALSPFLMLLIFSTFHLNAVKTLFGLYVWLIIWAVVDKILEGFWVSYAIRTWDVVSGVGLRQMDLFWALAGQDLAVLGGMRSFGMLISGMITYGVFQFGGSALAHLASSALSGAKAGVGEAAEAIRPEKRALERISKQWAYQSEWAAQITGTNLAYWTGLGTAKQMRGYERLGELEGAGTSADTWKEIGKARGMKRKTDAKALSLQGGDVYERLLDAARAKYGKQFWSGYRLTSFEKEMGLTPGADDATASAILKGEATLGTLTESQRGKILASAGLSSALTDTFKNAKLDYVGMENGKIAMTGMNGMFNKEDAKGLADWLRNHNLANVANGLEEMVEKYGSVKFRLFGGKDGLSYISFEAGGEARGYDLYHGKYRYERDITPDNPYKMETNFGTFVLTGGRLTKEGNTLAVVNGQTEDGSLVSNLVMNTKTGEVQKLERQFKDGGKLTNFLKKSGLWNVLSQDQRQTILNGKGPWKFTYDQGLVVMESGSDVIQLQKSLIDKSHQELYGSSIKHLDRETFDKPVKLTLNKNPLTEKEGVTHVLFQGTRNGYNLDGIAWVEIAPGKYSGPIEVHGKIDPLVKDPGKAFRRSRQGDPLILHKLQGNVIQDGIRVSGGAKVDTMATTEALLRIKQAYTPGTSEKLQAEGYQLRQVLFHSAEWAQYYFAMQTVDDLKNIIEYKHEVDLSATLRGIGRLWAQARSDKQAFGWLAEKISGLSAGARTEVALLLEKAAKDHTGVDMLRAAVWNIWSSKRLTDREKDIALVGLLAAVKEEALSTVKTGDDAKPAYTRGVDRVLDGAAPGHEVGKPGMGQTKEDLKAIGHAMKESVKPYSPEEIAEFAKNTFINAGVMPAKVDENKEEADKD